MIKNTNKSLNHIAPPPPPPIISSYIIEETLQKTHSLTQAFLAKTRKLALFPAFWGKLHLCVAVAPPRARTGKILDFAQRALNRKKSAAACPNKARPSLAPEGMPIFFQKFGLFSRSRVFRPLSILLLSATLGLAHCSSDDNGGGGGANNDTPDTPDTPSCTPSPKGLWTAELTAGERIRTGIETQYGYLLSTGTGTLSDTQFTHKGTDYTVGGFIAVDPIVGSDYLDILISPAPEDAVNSWTLDLGSSRSFAFNNTSDVRNDGQTFQWRPIDFLWADAETHTVKLIGNTCDD